MPRWVIGPLSQMQESDPDWFGALGEELGIARLGRGGLWVSGLEVNGHQHPCGLKPKRGHANLGECFSVWDLHSEMPGARIAYVQ